MATRLPEALTERPVPAQPVAQTRGLVRAFGARRVLDRLDIDIGRGEFVALIGRSGSGKSTLLRALAGLDRDIEGELVVSGEVAVAFQEPRLVPWKRVLANITLGLEHDDPKAAAGGALAEVGLTERAGAWPSTLSGGEAQRASLARALVREPDLLLLDEPFSALDALTRITIHRLVIDLWTRHGPGVLLVTHDVDEALLLADRVVVLGDGRISHESKVEQPRPRHRDHPAIVALRAELLTELGVEGATVSEPPDPLPEIYFGGSSQAAGPVAARHTDVYLTWGEPPDLVAEKIAWIRKLAEEEGRSVRFGIRLHVISRDRPAEAWAEAQRLLDAIDPAHVAKAQEALSRSDSVGQQRMRALHAGFRESGASRDLEIYPNLWAGVGLVRGGAGTALVGSHTEVADRIAEYASLGVEEFIFSGYPHLEEAYWFGEGVLPEVRRRGGAARLKESA